MFKKNKLWILLVGVCFVGKAESATFGEIVEEGGLPRCVALAANTARNYNFVDLKCNFAWLLASAIHVTGRIGEETHQITAREFAELLDRSGIRPVLDVAEDAAILRVAPGSWRESARIPASSDCIKVVHGGGLSCVSRFVAGVQGYRVSERGTQKCEGMWLSPCSASIAFEGRTDLYGWRHSPLFFDRPVVLVAEVDPSALNVTANDSYEKVLPLDRASSLRDVQLFEPELTPDAGEFYPIGARFNSDSTADFAHRISGLSPALAAKLSKWRVY